LLALGGRDVGLQKFRIGIRLQLDHVRWRNDFLDLAEINTFCGSRWHFILSVGHGNTPHRFLLNDTRQARRVQRPACPTSNRLFYLSKLVNITRLSRVKKAAAQRRRPGNRPIT
jgi:hypothetical protein